jgi:nickel-dependent lactate racemase
MAAIRIPFGHESLEISVREGQVLHGHRGPRAPTLADVGTAMRQAVEEPLEFPPLRRALTPDDHVVVAIAQELNHLPDLLAPLLDHVVSAGLQPANITLLCRSESADSVRQAHALLPVEQRTVAVEVHDPADRSRLSYLASTKAGRRIYLNRTLVDADQIVILSRTMYDPILGYGGGLGDLFPALSDEATRSEFALKATTSPAYSPVLGRGTPAWHEAQEVGWLLGMPFVLEVIEGNGDDISYVRGGSAKQVMAEADRLLDRHWRVGLSRTADVVVAGISGAAERQTFGEVTRALSCAARVVRFGGGVIVLCHAHAPTGAGAALLRHADNPVQGLLLAQQQKTADVVSIWQLVAAAQHARLYLLSDMPAATAEELFVTPLESPEQVQRLINGADSCLLLPDAHRTLAVLE